MKKSSKTRIWVILGLMLTTLILYPKVSKLWKNKNEEGGGNRAMVTSVDAVVIKPIYLAESVRVSGTLTADEMVDLSFETSGRLTAIYFDEGQAVKKGTLLAKLNYRDLQGQLSKLKILQKLIEEKEYRQRTLLEKEAVSREAYDQILTELKSNEAEIEIINTRIAYTEIRAPFDGIIGLRYVSPGAYVTPTVYIARLTKISPLKVDFSVPEKYSGIVKIGNNLDFTVEGLPNKYQARVYALEPTIDVQTRNILLRATYSNTQRNMLPGRFVSIELTTKDKNNAICVPTQSIIPEAGREKVFLVQNNVVKQSFVQTGIRTDKLIEIISGVSSGDTVLTTGILQAKQDMPVTIKNLISIDQMP
jgi:membrane fusion protein (multidrug efflux system)